MDDDHDHLLSTEDQHEVNPYKNNQLFLKTHQKRKKLIAFELKEKGIARKGYDLVNEKNEKIGYVTSGTMSPYLNKSIGMGFIYQNALFNDFFILIRNRKIEAGLVKLPFIKKS